MIRRPPRSTRVRSSAASDVYKRQQVSEGHPGGRGDLTKGAALPLAGTTKDVADLAPQHDHRTTSLPLSRHGTRRRARPCCHRPRTDRRTPTVPRGTDTVAGDTSGSRVPAHGDSNAGGGPGVPPRSRFTRSLSLI